MKDTTFDEVLMEYYKGIVLFGIVFVAMAIWLYEYHYTADGDEILGILSACSLFFGTILIGQGIRGWRDGDDWRNRYTSIKSRGGAEFLIKNRKKKVF
jgi:hypothetical protein